MDVFYGVTSVILGLVAYFMLNFSMCDIGNKHKAAAVLMLVGGLGCLGLATYLCLWHWNMWTAWGILAVAWSAFAFLYDWHKRPGMMPDVVNDLSVIAGLEAAILVPVFLLWLVTSFWGVPKQAEELARCELVHVNDGDHPDALVYVSSNDENYLFYYRQDGEIKYCKTCADHHDGNLPEAVHILDDDKSKSEVSIVRTYAEHTDSISGEPFVRELHGVDNPVYEVYVHNNEVAHVDNLNDYEDRRTG